MRIKGTVLIALLEFIAEEFGEEAKAVWLADLDKECKHTLGHVLESAWYPLEPYLESAIAACERFAPGRVRQAMRKLGAHGARGRFAGAYRFMLRIGSPNLIITTVQKQWGKLNIASVLTVLVNTPGRAVIRISDVGTRNPYWADIIAGWLDETLEQTGYSTRKVAVTQVPEGNTDFFEFSLEWS